MSLSKTQAKIIADASRKKHQKMVIIGGWGVHKPVVNHAKSLLEKRPVVRVKCYHRLPGEKGDAMTALAKETGTRWIHVKDEFYALYKTDVFDKPELAAMILPQPKQPKKQSPNKKKPAEQPKKAAAINPPPTTVVRRGVSPTTAPLIMPATIPSMNSRVFVPTPRQK
jgi:RNA-binding protein YhbY